jgi:hypothetical protein
LLVSLIAVFFGEQGVFNPKDQPPAFDNECLGRSGPVPIFMRSNELVLLMANPKPKEDDLAIPSFLDRRKPEPKPDRKAAKKLVEHKPPPVELDA